MSLAEMMHFLQDVFQMTAIAHVTEINHYHMGYIYEVNTISFQTFFVWYFKFSKTLENSQCYCYTSYEMTDQILWFQV